MSYIIHTFFFKSWFASDKSHTFLKKLIVITSDLGRPTFFYLLLVLITLNAFRLLVKRFELFESLLSRYQIGLETTMKDSDYIFDVLTYCIKITIK